MLIWCLHYYLIAQILLFCVIFNICVFITEFHLSGLIGTASHPDMQKIRIFGFFFENRLHRQFAVWLLLFTVRTCV